MNTPHFRLRLLVCLAGICAVMIPAAAQQGQGYIKTKINPGRAGVFIDGKYVGPAANFGSARRYALPAGEHEIRFAEPRYEPLTLKVNVEAGKTTTASHSLKPLELAKPPFGMLRIKGAEKFTPVFLNGAYYGHAGEFNNSVQGLKLNPGKYTLKVGSGAGQEVSIEADKTTVIQASK